MWFSPWLTTMPISLLVPFVDIHDVDMHIRDLWRDDSWQLHTLYTQLPQEVIDLIRQLTPFIVENIPDAWVWKHDFSGKYSVKSAYAWLANGQGEQNPAESWAWIWKLRLPANI